MKIRCDEGLRLRAMAKAHGDYESHEVPQTANAYAAWCDSGDVEKAAWAEARLRMFVDTPLRWKEACIAISHKGMPAGAKRIFRVRSKLGRFMNPEEKARWRRSEKAG